MAAISKQEFLVWQPCYPVVKETDPFYYEVVCRLFEIAKQSAMADLIPEEAMKRMSLCMVGYFQDIIADGGIWRSFVEANRKLYGWAIPFHMPSEDYVDYELNREDVNFLTWYSLAMSYEPLRTIYPHNVGILKLAGEWFEYLESIYEESPEPTDFAFWRGLDFYDDADRSEIYRLGQWLYMHCYLLTPALGYTLGEIMAENPELQKEDNITLLHDRLEKSMMEDPTGPLALFIPEWIYLLLNGKLLKPKKEETEVIHPYYEKFIAYTKGNPIAFFQTYEQMNTFFIEALGWEKGEHHLAQMKGEKDFVLMVNRHKGMLMARNVARCIAAPENPYYDKEYAKTHAFDLLSIRGLCPGDLLQKIFENKWLPDARFPGTEDTKIVEENHDFIARCYLQQYYRGD